MDVTALRTAYDRFLEAARGSRDAVPPDGEWQPELVLAHVVVGDRLIAQTVAQVLGGGEARFDNRISHCRPYLEAVADAAEGWEGLLAAVRQAGDELLAVAARIEPEQASVMVPSLVVDGGDVVIDGPAPLAQLVAAPSVVHLPGHAAQLEAYGR